MPIVETAVAPKSLGCVTSSGRCVTQALSSTGLVVWARGGGGGALIDRVRCYTAFGGGGAAAVARIDGSRGAVI